MSAQPLGEARPSPGRPSTGARERILDACLEVLKSDGYAGLTIAKVASRAGENKALVAYHFGSKQGLIAAAARALGETITGAVVAGMGGAKTIAEVVQGTFDGTLEVIKRDERLPRVYFDLNAVSVVEEDIRRVMREVKRGWVEVLTGLLREAGVPARRAGPGALMLISGNEGLLLARIEDGESAAWRSARRMFAAAAIAELGR